MKPLDLIIHCARGEVPAAEAHCARCQVEARRNPVAGTAAWANWN